MRFIHAADLHIDSPLKGLSRYEGAPLAQLRGATRRALERLVELAIDEKVDFVLIAGDLYDCDWQDFHTGLFVREQMVKLGKKDIRVFIVQGNHDAQGVISRQVPWPDNVKVFSSRKAETVRLDADRNAGASQPGAVLQSLAGLPCWRGGLPSVHRLHARCPDKFAVQVH